jgi:hypothetical protein
MHSFKSKQLFLDHGEDVDKKETSVEDFWLDLATGQIDGPRGSGGKKLVGRIAFCNILDIFTPMDL